MALPLREVAILIGLCPWSGLTTAEIDATIARLMRAAEVTGVGLAIINDCCGITTSPLTIKLVNNNDVRLI